MMAHFTSAPCKETGFKSTCSEDSPEPMSANQNPSNLQIILSALRFAMISLFPR